MGGMMRYFVFIGIAFLLVITIFSTVLSQESVDRILEKAERATESTQSDAVILLGEGVYTVEADGRGIWICHQQILLLSWEAIDFYGELYLPYSDDLEDLVLDYARTILSDGTVSDLDESAVYDVPYLEMEDAPVYSDACVLCASMPALKPGAVIDFQYTVREKIPIVPGEFSTAWLLGWDDPVVESRFVVDAPAGMALRWHVEGITLSPEIQTISQRVQYTFLATDLPPIGFEPGMPAPSAVSPHIVVSSLESWGQIAAWWSELADGKAKADAAIAAKVEELTGILQTEQEKVSALYDFVAREIRYVVLEFGMGGFEPRPASSTFKSRYGDCKDQAMLLIAMLELIGVEACPVLLNTLEGYHQDFSLPPFLATFDHVIVALPTEDGWHFLDPTCSYCTTSYMDAFIREHEGLLIGGGIEQSGLFVETGRLLPVENLVDCELMGVVSEEGTLTATAEIRPTGDWGLQCREMLSYYRPYERRDLFESMLDFAIPQARLTDFEYSDPNALHSPIQITLEFEKNRFVQTLPGGSRLVPLPYAPSIPIPADYAEFVIAEKREYVLLEIPTILKLAGRLTLPSGTSVVLPEDCHFENPVGSFHATYEFVEGRLVYQRTFQLNLSEIPASDYPLYRELILTMLEDAEAVAVLE
jgi:transglutaminase-like putative cysteine protease